MPVVVTYNMNFKISAVAFSMHQNAVGWYDQIEVRAFDAIDEKGSQLPVAYRINNQKQTWTVGTKFAESHAALYGLLALF